jgi:predicted acyl esterase
MRHLLGLLVLASICMTVQAQAQTYGVTTQTGVAFVEHDGVKLLGDLYLPKGRDKAPVLVAVHGGGWQIGNPKFWAVSRQERLRAVCRELPPVEAGRENLPRRGLRRQIGHPVRAR